MLGVQILLLIVICFLVGMELSAPGSVPAMIRATAQVTLSVRDGTAATLCAHLEARGVLCPAF